MQIKIFSVPVIDGEWQNEELNVFLRSKKILQVEKQLISNGRDAFWSFCIQYLEDASIGDRNKARVDYRLVLDDPTFERFSALREIRKEIARKNSLPIYAVFTNEELADMARLDERTLPNIKSIKGIGAKKVEKYGQYFLHNTEDDQE